MLHSQIVACAAAAAAPSHLPAALTPAPCLPIPLPCPPLLQVDDLATVLKFPVEPFFTRSDDNGKIITRWLNDSYPFTVEVAQPRKD